MIKLEIELKDEKLLFNYTVGSSISAGETQLCPDTLNTFNLIVQMCHKVHCQRYTEWLDEIRAKGYLKEHPELLEAQKG